MTKNPFRAPALLLSMALSALAVGCSSPTGTSISTACRGAHSFLINEDFLPIS